MGYGTIIHSTHIILVGLISGGKNCILLCFNFEVPNAFSYINEKNLSQEHLLGYYIQI